MQNADIYDVRLPAAEAAPNASDGVQGVGLMALTVAVREVLADGVVALSLRDPSGGPVPSWEPGAHIDVQLDSDVVRQYSLCGDPSDRSALRVAVLREQAGRGGSAHVHDRLAVGDTVLVGGPRNNFELRPSSRYLFIAGGIGITPILPMLAAATAAGADWKLVYGGRSRASMAFLPELAEYGSRVSVRPQDEVGLLALDSLLAEPQPGTLVYCCGPAPLLDAVQQRCAPGSLYVERFAAGELAEPVRGESFTVELVQSGLTLTVPPDRSILQVADEAGVPVLFSCREGTCGTCETPVLDGVPDHRDVLLTDEERAANDTMFICVSRSCTPSLTLDM